MSPKRLVIVLALLAAAGPVKLLLEENLAAALRRQGLLQPSLGLDLRENLGQMGFAASLGGLRSLVASITYLQAYGAFEDTDWGRVDSLMTLTTRLQPREVSYWDEASWHQAYNAASFYLRDTSLRAAIRSKLFRDHVQRGIDILREGLRHLPDHRKLLARLGEIYSARQQDPRRAAETFLLAYEHGGGAFYERRAAYEMVKLSDRESWVRAYEILRRHYDNGLKMKGTTLMRDLAVLEDRLGVPPERRARPAERDEPARAPVIRPRIPGARPAP